MKKPGRLPPLTTLRVKEPNKTPANPCIAVMSSVLACWASAGYNTQGCAALENALRNCMDHPVKTKTTSSPINFHLGRMIGNVVQQKKNKKPTKANK